MIISELISRLEEIKTEHGDLPVIRFNRGYAEGMDESIIQAFYIEPGYIDSSDMVDHWYPPDEPLLGTKKIVVI